MQEGDWDVTSRDASRVTFARRMRVENWSRTAFDVAVERTIRVLGDADVRARFGEGPPAGTKWIAFESDNAITNAGTAPWSRATGLLSVWILGMYAPAADARVVIPFDPAATGPLVNDAYFGKIPAERLHVHDRWLEARGRRAAAGQARRERGAARRECSAATRRASGSSRWWRTRGSTARRTAT